HAFGRGHAVGVAGGVEDSRRHCEIEPVLAAGIADRDARSIASDHELVSERDEGIEDPIGSEIERGDKTAPVLGSCPKLVLVPVRRLTSTKDWETGESLATSIVFVFTSAIARTGPCEKLVIVVGRAVVVSIADTVVGPPKLLKLVPIRLVPLKVRPSMSPKPVLPISVAAPVVLLTENRFPR